MRNPLFFGGKKMRFAIKNNKILFLNLINKIKALFLLRESDKNKKFHTFLFLAIAILFIGTSVRVWNTSPFFYVDASTENGNEIRTIKSPLFEQKNLLIQNGSSENSFSEQILNQNKDLENIEITALKQKLYEIVGDAPIKEMVPFISQRDEKVAAFLVGIAKKESSFGLASPLKDGKTCFNYWGYKGSGERGVGMGYACFASAEEAIRVVGNRIEVLVNKNNSTPSLMVDTWKCGKSCKGDPGAPGWVLTVEMYFNQIIG